MRPAVVIPRSESRIEQTLERGALLIVEGRFELCGVHYLLTLLRRHRAQAIPGVTHVTASIIWELPKLLQRVPQEILFILRQRFDSLHAVQHAFLPLRRQAVELI